MALDQDPNPGPKLDTKEKVAEWLRQEYPNSYAAREPQGWQWENDEDHWWQIRESVRNKGSGLPGSRIERDIPSWYLDVQRNYRGSEWHAPFVSKVNPLMIGMTPTKAYGRQDRQVTTTVVKFLRKFYPTQINEITALEYNSQHRYTYGTNEVLFVFDADEILNLYTVGPRSCMSHATLGAEREHCVRMYDGPDFAFACLRKGDASFSARALIRIDTSPMEYYRIYGDATVLKRRLEILGFVPQTRLTGGRLRLVRSAPHGNQVIQPYLDWATGTRIRPDGFLHVINDPAGELAQFEGATTSGWACKTGNTTEEGDPIPVPVHDEDREHRCHHCEDWFPLDAGGDNDQHGHWICEGCLDENFVYARTVNGSSYCYRDDCCLVSDTWYLADQSTLDHYHIVWSYWDDEWIFSTHPDARQIYDDGWTLRATVEDFNGVNIMADRAVRFAGLTFDPNWSIPEGVVRKPGNTWGWDKPLPEQKKGDLSLPYREVTRMDGTKIRIAEIQPLNLQEVLDEEEDACQS